MVKFISVRFLTQLTGIQDRKGLHTEIFGIRSRLKKLGMEGFHSKELLEMKTVMERNFWPKIFLGKV